MCSLDSLNNAIEVEYSPFDLIIFGLGTEFFLHRNICICMTTFTFRASNLIESVGIRQDFDVYLNILPPMRQTHFG